MAGAGNGALLFLCDELVDLGALGVCPAQVGPLLDAPAVDVRLRHGHGEDQKDRVELAPPQLRIAVGSARCARNRSLKRINTSTDECVNQ